MRSKATNFLQIVILITAVLYVIIGIIFFISPITLGKMLSIDITDDWFNGIMYDTFIAPLYFIARGFAAMIFSVGLSMVLPLFDPLRYRGLLYYTGIVFPLMSSYVMLKNGRTFNFGVVVLFGLLFIFIFVMTAIGLIITKKEASVGIE